jgi:hypothetical protein
MRHELLRHLVLPVDCGLIQLQHTQSKAANTNGSAMEWFRQCSHGDDLVIINVLSKETSRRGHNYKVPGRILEVLHLLQLAMPQQAQLVQQVQVLMPVVSFHCWFISASRIPIPACYERKAIRSNCRSHRKSVSVQVIAC